MSSAYNGVMPLVSGAVSWVVTRILLRPRRKLMQLCCQFCFMLAECNHGLPSNIGYAPEASNASTTADISKRWPPTTIPNFRINPNGLIEWVSAIRS